MEKSRRKTKMKAVAGMKLEEHLLDSHGRVLLRKGTVVSASNIERLKALGITYVSVPCNITSENESVADSNRFKSFCAGYIPFKNETKKLIMSISGGGLVNMCDLVRLTDAIIEKSERDMNITKYLAFLDSIDDETFSHSLNVSILCNFFGRWLGFKDPELRELTIAGLLHDVGKTRIPSSIILKPGKLTDSEFFILKTHTTQGYAILREQKLSRSIKFAALMHHEKFDGTGYPGNLFGSSIDDIASIVSICDIYDAMTSNRCYRKKICPFDVIESLQKGIYGKLNARYLTIFLNNISQSYKDCRCELSDGRNGKVVFINPLHLSRPIIQLNHQEFLDLDSNPNISIEKVI